MFSFYLIRGATWADTVPRKLSIMAILHVPTLIAVNIILLFMAVGTYLVILEWNPGVPGVRHWAVGNLFHAFGFLLLLSRTALHPIFSVVCANALIIIGYYTIYMGFRIYQGKTATDKITLILFLVLLVLFSTALIKLTQGNGTNSMALRSSLNSMVIACMCFLIAFEIAGIPLHDRFITSGFAILITLHGVFNLIRSAITLTVPDTRTLFEGGGMARIAFSESVIALFALTIGYILLISNHLLGQLRRQAEIDYLTDVFTRRAFIKLVEKARATSQRNNSTISLISIDLDRFKAVNDKYGHAAGDAALRYISSTITSILRPSDILGRVGGEEFMVLLPQTEISKARDVAERLRLQVELAEVEFEKERINLTISLGVSSAPRGEKPFDQLAKESDIALYKAKNEGRNRAVMFQEDQ